MFLLSCPEFAKHSKEKSYQDKASVNTSAYNMAKKIFSKEARLIANSKMVMIFCDFEFRLNH